MEMVNCPRCGKVFTRMSDPLCNNCMKEEEKIFENVRDYINEHPSNRLEEVARECGVTVKKIMGYIRDGRLEASNGMRGDFMCAQCGKPIKRGKMCDACVVEVNHQINQMFDDSSNRKGGPAMHSRHGKDR